MGGDDGDDVFVYYGEEERREIERRERREGRAPSEVTHLKGEYTACI